MDGSHHQYIAVTERADRHHVVRVDPVDDRVWYLKAFFPDRADADAFAALKNGTVPVPVATKGFQKLALTDEQRAEIARRVNAGEGQAAISREFGLTGPQVNDLMKRWRRKVSKNDLPPGPAVAKAQGSAEVPMAAPTAGTSAPTTTRVDEFTQGEQETRPVAVGNGGNAGVSGGQPVDEFSPKPPRQAQPDGAMASMLAAGIHPARVAAACRASPETVKKAAKKTPSGVQVAPSTRPLPAKPRAGEAAILAAAKSIVAATFKAAEIIKITGQARGSVDAYLSLMVARGMVVRVSPGVYALPESKPKPTKDNPFAVTPIAIEAAIAKLRALGRSVEPQGDAYLVDDHLHATAEDLIRAAAQTAPDPRLDRPHRAVPTEIKDPPVAQRMARR